MVDERSISRPMLPPVMPPVLSIGDQRNAGSSSSGGGFRAARRRQARMDEDGATREDELFRPTPTFNPSDPTGPLLEALDRLRIMGELRPAEMEYARALRGLRTYDETTRSFNPVSPVGTSLATNLSTNPLTSPGDDGTAMSLV